MTRKLEELFDLPPTSKEVDTSVPSIPDNREKLAVINDAIDKIDAALPMVKGLEATDMEMDDLAKKATDSYDELIIGHASGFKICSRNIFSGQQHAGPCNYSQNSQAGQKT